MNCIPKNFNHLTSINKTEWNNSLGQTATEFFFQFCGNFVATIQKYKEPNRLHTERGERSILLVASSTVFFYFFHITLAHYLVSDIDISTGKRQFQKLPTRRSEKKKTCSVCQPLICSHRIWLTRDYILIQVVLFFFCFFWNATSSLKLFTKMLNYVTRRQKNSLTSIATLFFGR